MRKNKMMRAASGILVATLMTTSIISGTFAKYTTSVEGSDKARVASWGIGQEGDVEFTNLFTKDYTNVKSATEDDLIAPGTSGSATFTFGYTAPGVTTGIAAPEVAYKFTVSTDGSTISNDIKNNSNIKWKLDNGTPGTWDELIAAIEKLDGTDGAEGKEYAPGTLPTGFTAKKETHTVSWEWTFHTDDGADHTDTSMTVESANPIVHHELGRVTLAIKVSAVQID